MRGYEFTRRAALDFEAARDWYAQRGSDLGRRFVDDVVLAIRAARERPGSFPVARAGVRTVRCNKFPYRLYFETLADRIVVLAIYHTARDPEAWDDPRRT